MHVHDWPMGGIGHPFALAFLGLRGRGCRPSLPSLGGPARPPSAAQTLFLSASCIWWKKGAKARVSTGSVGQGKRAGAWKRVDDCLDTPVGKTTTRPGKLLFAPLASRRLPLSSSRHLSAWMRFEILSVVCLPGWVWWTKSCALGQRLEQWQGSTLICHGPCVRLAPEASEVEKLPSSFSCFSSRGH